MGWQQIKTLLQEALHMGACENSGKGYPRSGNPKTDHNLTPYPMLSTPLEENDDDALRLPRRTAMMHRAYLRGPKP